MEVSLEEMRAVAQSLIEAGDNKALRTWFISHWSVVADERLTAVLESTTGVARERLARLQELVLRARERGLVATVLDLVPLASELISAADRYLAAETWADRLSLLHQDGPLLTSADAEAYMASKGRTRQLSIPIVDEAIKLALVTREKGIEFARQWAIAQLLDRSQGTIPRLAFDALRELLMIPLSERAWDPLTETLWADLLWRYQSAIGDWVAFRYGLSFFKNLQTSAVLEWAPNSMVELKLATAKLYLVRPLGPDSDRAHNIELALSYGMQALDGVNRGYAPGARARVHEMLGRIYAVRFQQDSVEALENARHHFMEALNAYDAKTMPHARAEVSRLIGWSMTELAHRSFDPTSRRKAIMNAIDTLRTLPRTEDNVYADAELADALALNGEFDPNSLVEATALIEAVLNRTAADRPPTIRVATSQEHEAHLTAVTSWAYCRYMYANIAVRRRAREPDFAISRAICEIADAEAYLSDWGKTGERPSGSELHGDLLMFEGKWQDALDAYARVSQTPFPSAPVLYDPFTVQGQDAMATGASQVDAKVAYCLCRLGDPITATLVSDRSKTQAILNALRWEDLAARIPEGDRRNNLLAALAEVRMLEARSRLAIQSLGERPDTETEWQLIKARAHLNEIATTGSESEDISAFKLTQQDIFAAIPTEGVLVVPLVTPVGSAFVAFRNEKQGDPVIRITYSALTIEDCRDLLGRYVQILENVSRPTAGGDPVRILKDLLVVLSDGLARDLRRTAVAVGARSDAPLRLVSHMGIGTLPLHATTDEVTHRTLYEDYVYSSIPSIGVVAYQMRRDPVADRRTEALIVVNPTGDLPYALLEGHLVAGAIPAGQSRIVAGRAATKNQVMRSARATNLHFAGHAKADLSAPWRSTLKAADGDLSAAEVAGGSFAGPTLVTLSACETGFSDLKYAPNEFGGLATAFLMSGARSVVSSLWPMYDIPTALLMGRFYRVIRKHPAMDIPRALRCAELWLRSANKPKLEAWITAQEGKRPLAQARNWPVRWQLLKIRFELWLWNDEGPPYRDPYHWAGFVPLTVHG